jgi:DMSO/TMAO reductase YedYZ heme-binding membrane subunit
MIKLLIDFLQFLYSTLPLLTCVTIFTLLCILLSKSIKRHSTIYYIVLGIPFILVAIPFIGRLFGAETFNLNGIPFLGGILRDYIHMGTLGFPLLIIIMYMGALDTKIPAVRKLMSIRKEISIISGFPVLTHSLIRVTNNFLNSLQFFTNNAEYMETTKVTNELGAGITNFSFVLGIVLVVIFIPLWITSFDSVHKRIGNRKWKKLQKWSYVLYALLFIHAMCIQVGSQLNPRGGRNAPGQTVQVTSNTTENNRKSAATTSGFSRGGQDNDTQSPEERRARNEQGGDGSLSSEGRRGERGSQPSEGLGTIQRNSSNERPDVAQPDQRGGGQQGQSQISQQGNRRPQSIGFADINVSQQTKRYLHMISLILIFGSYLYLRLRKYHTSFNCD